MDLTCEKNDTPCWHENSSVWPRVTATNADSEGNEEQGAIHPLRDLSCRMMSNYEHFAEGVRTYGIYAFL